MTAKRFNPNAITPERIRHGLSRDAMRRSTQSNNLQRVATCRLPKASAESYNAGAKIFKP
jgi:hypothetical protein